MIGCHGRDSSSSLMCGYSGNGGVRCCDQTVGIGGGYRRCRTGRDRGGEAAVVVVITGGWRPLPSFAVVAVALG